MIWPPLTERLLAHVTKAEKIRSSQYNKSLRRLSSLSEEDKQAIALLTTSIVDKILRDPILYLKSSDDNGNDNDRAETIRELFGLDETKDNE